ncbi:cupin domain-containing protein [Methylicorpusculum oleiharenae]|uniref:cupin domain-containing protein n=1 Tax=Methylicorpusculum oleiharenae TaxID=1338687 RepID=UPI00135A3CE2|nr:cupin domain-containing protein [Methylicorpusculum oleiharenae]MCD2450465.1 cupin domain-containing protein [Methylicorpusculum oleiharenae]
MNSLQKTLRFSSTICLIIYACAISASELDPKAISIKLPEQINWVANPSGSETAVLVGDPSKPGLYVVLNKWKANHNSKPHSHPNDRFITVISGTWWVGTGTDYDPDSLKPVPEGSFVTHYGNEIHYDGAKDGDVILQIVGIGPATSAPATPK